MGGPHGMHHQLFAVVYGSNSLELWTFAARNGDSPFGNEAMKRIHAYRQLLGATATTNLQDLSKLYKSLMKTYHPDRFPDDAEKREEAEVRSKEIIEAYHFLSSIAPETRQQDAEEYARLTALPILDFRFEQRTLRITFADGTEYEYFGVPHNTYMKFVNTDGNPRFARRHIYDAYPCRRAKRADAVHA